MAHQQRNSFRDARGLYTGPDTESHHSVRQSDCVEMEEAEEVSCYKCHNRPEDVLILTCDHNLCLECASNNLHE